MARQEFTITTIGPRSLSALLQTLLQRQVDVIELAATRRPDDDGEGYEVRLTADLAEAEDQMLVKRVNRLLDVVKVVQLDSGASHRRRAIIVQVDTDEKGLSGVLALASVFDAKVLELTNASVTLEHVASPDRVDDLLDLLHPLGVIRLADAGTLAMPRGRRRRTGGRSERARVAVPTPSRSSAPAPRALAETGIMRTPHRSWT